MVSLKTSLITLALPSLAYGVGTAMSMSRVRYLEDENNQLQRCAGPRVAAQRYAYQDRHAT